MTRMKPQILNVISYILFERFTNCLIFELHHTCKICISLNALHRISSPISTFEPVKSFIHVNVRTDDKVYNWDTATINFIFILVVSMISKILNIKMPQ
jgi:hypothetical protein